MKTTVRDAAPPWVKEKRRPTREELAAKHFADGGMAAPATKPETEAFFADAGEAAPINVRRFK